MRCLDESGALHMSTDDIDPTAQLKRDFESYLKGGEPSPLELARAPLLEGWRATVLQFRRERGPLPTVLVLVGRVTGHPRLSDARVIRTSHLIWLDCNRKWARTWNRIYRLGDRTDNEPVTPT
jgi:hypothetical protein